MKKTPLPSKTKLHIEDEVNQDKVWDKVVKDLHAKNQKQLEKELSTGKIGGGKSKYYHNIPYLIKEKEPKVKPVLEIVPQAYRGQKAYDDDTIKAGPSRVSPKRNQEPEDRFSKESSLSVYLENIKNDPRSCATLLPEQAKQYGESDLGLVASTTHRQSHSHPNKVKKSNLTKQSDNVPTIRERGNVSILRMNKLIPRRTTSSTSQESEQKDPNPNEETSNLLDNEDDHSKDSKANDKDSRGSGNTNDSGSSTYTTDIPGPKEQPRRASILVPPANLTSKRSVDSQRPSKEIYVSSQHGDRKDKGPTRGDEDLLKGKHTLAEAANSKQGRDKDIGKGREGDRNGGRAKDRDGNMDKSDKGKDRDKDAGRDGDTYSKPDKGTSHPKKDRPSKKPDKYNTQDDRDRRPSFGYPKDDLSTSFKLDSPGADDDDDVKGGFRVIIPKTPGHCEQSQTELDCCARAYAKLSQDFTSQLNAANKRLMSKDGMSQTGFGVDRGADTRGAPLPEDNTLSEILARGPIDRRQNFGLQDNFYDPTKANPPVTEFDTTPYKGSYRAPLNGNARGWPYGRNGLADQNAYPYGWGAPHGIGGSSMLDDHVRGSLLNNSNGPYSRNALDSDPSRGYSDDINKRYYGVDPFLDSYGLGGPSSDSNRLGGPFSDLNRAGSSILDSNRPGGQLSDPNRLGKVSLAQEPSSKDRLPKDIYDKFIGKENSYKQYGGVPITVSGYSSSSWKKENNDACYLKVNASYLSSSHLRIN